MVKAEPLTKDPGEVAELFRKMGLLGAGGAGFPTYFKYVDPTPTLIVNCQEGEPGFEADKLLLKTHVEELQLILSALQEIFDIEKIYLGAKDKDRERLAPLEDRFNIAYTPSLYGMGEERWLTKSVTGIAVPPDKFPPQCGVTVNNVETVYNMYRALFLEKPVTHKYLNVYGEVAQPRVYLAPVGAYVMDLLGMTGVITENSHELMCIDGGPMMGDKVGVGSYAVKKTTNGLLVTDQGLFKRRDETTPTWNESLSQIMEKLGIERYLDWEPREAHDLSDETERVKLFLKQGLGQPCDVSVESGQKVQEDQEIGSAIEGNLSNFQCLSIGLHVPISGTVTEVTGDYVMIER
jgi:electron transport complex protein RnfC